METNNKNLEELIKSLQERVDALEFALDNLVKVMSKDLRGIEEENDGTISLFYGNKDNE